MIRRRWVVTAATVLLLVLLSLPAIVFPHPEVWEHFRADRDYPRAAFSAYRAALGIHRPSGVPLNGLTYTFLIRRGPPREIEVVFLPRNIVRHVFPRQGEEIHLFLRRPSMVLVRWHFGE